VNEHIEEQDSSE
jgi:hypothetical protein